MATLKEQAIKAFQAQQEAAKAAQVREEEALKRKIRQDNAEALRRAIVHTDILPRDVHYDIFFEGRQALVQYEDLLLGNNYTAHSNVAVFVRCPLCNEAINLGGANDLVSLGHVLSRADNYLATHEREDCSVTYNRRLEQRIREEEESKANGTDWASTSKPVPTLEERNVEALERIATTLEELTAHFTQ